MIAPTPDHVWWHSVSDGQNHLYPADTRPDDECILTAACMFVAMGFRVARAEYGPYCWGCLRLTGAHQADRLEAKAAALAARQRSELDGGVPEA